MKPIHFTWRASGTILVILALVAGTAQSQDKTSALRRYVGSPDYTALLNEPTVKANLAAAAGTQLPALMRNLAVSGDVDRIGGALMVAGNAPHKGGEEEAVICVAEYDGKVEAALFSKSRVTVFAKDKNYEFLMRCVKDWITQVSSGHRDRIKQPANVQFANPG